MLANGIGTNHPVPDLPFVDDSHIPIDDPSEFEAVGRHPGTDTWGRRSFVAKEPGTPCTLAGDVPSAGLAAAACVRRDMAVIQVLAGRLW